MNLLTFFSSRNLITLQDFISYRKKEKANRNINIVNKKEVKRNDIKKCCSLKMRTGTAQQKKKNLNRTGRTKKSSDEISTNSGKNLNENNVQINHSELLGKCVENKTSTLSSSKTKLMQLFSNVDDNNLAESSSKETSKSCCKGEGRKVKSFKKQKARKRIRIVTSSSEDENDIESKLASCISYGAGKLMHALIFFFVYF